MHELACPNCNSTSQYDFEEIYLMCPYCSATFRIDFETGQKDIFGDHYIVPNMSDPGQIKGIVIEWLRRMHHKPSAVEKEYFVVDIAGYSIPYWIISMEAPQSVQACSYQPVSHRLTTFFNPPPEQNTQRNGTFIEHCKC